jgi:hypothetical protein
MCGKKYIYIFIKNEYENELNFTMQEEKLGSIKFESST